MQLDAQVCWERLHDARHGSLGTVHDARGVDLVPVVFVVHDQCVVIPVDTVKPKSSPRLQRLRNLRVDARATLLVDSYDEDWSALWWVRVHGTAKQHPPTGAQLVALAQAFEPYRDAGTVTSVIVLEPREVTGWAAGPSA